MNMTGVNNDQRLDSHFDFRITRNRGFHVIFGKYSHVFASYHEIMRKVQTSRVGMDLINVTIQVNRFYQASDYNYVKYKERLLKRLWTLGLIDKSITIAGVIVSTKAFGILPGLGLSIFIKGCKYLNRRKRNIVKELNQLDKTIGDFKAICQGIHFDNNNVMSGRNQNLVCYYSILALLIWTMEKKLQKHRLSFRMNGVQGNRKLSANDVTFNDIYQRYF